MSFHPTPNRRWKNVKSGKLIILNFAKAVEGSTMLISVQFLVTLANTLMPDHAYQSCFETLLTMMNVVGKLSKFSEKSCQHHLYLMSKFNYLFPITI